MPYVACPRCGMKTFSAASWSSLDECQGCGARLPRRRVRRVDGYEAKVEDYLAQLRAGWGSSRRPR